MTTEETPMTDTPKPGMHLVHSWDTSLQESIEDVDMTFRIFRDKYPDTDPMVAATLAHAALSNMIVEDDQ